MNLKLTLIGGVVFYLVVLLLSFVTGPLIHEGILEEAYQANEGFWQPALAQDPPDMGALMPTWIRNGLIWGFVIAGIYGCCRNCCSGPGWKRGLWYGVGLTLIAATTYLGWSGVMYLPAEIWVWWTVDSAIAYLVGCTVLGIVAEKISPA